MKQIMFLQWRIVVYPTIISLNECSTGLFLSFFLSFFLSLFCRDSPQWTTASSFTRFLDHIRRYTTVGKTALEEWSARHRDLYLPTHDTHNRHPRHRWDSSPQSQQANGRRPKGGRWGRADNLTTFICRLSWNMGASPSWNPQGL